MSTYFSLPPSAQSAIGYTLNGNLSITTLRELSLSPMECLTFFASIGPTTILRPARENSCAWNISICSVSLWGAKLEIRFAALHFFS
jgi:hypothetical protein